MTHIIQVHMISMVHRYRDMTDKCRSRFNSINEHAYVSVQPGTTYENMMINMYNKKRQVINFNNDINNNDINSTITCTIIM